MEPDHSANIVNFVKEYPNVTVVSSAKAFAMMEKYFGSEFTPEQIVVGEGSILSLGKHELKFITAPMVHWPEVVLSYDSTDKVLFSADAFGKFGVFDIDKPWIDEARRYYFGIVGKYGAQVQMLLKKAAGLNIEKICALHGPILDGNIKYYFDLYNIWSSYQSEEEGIVLAYTSVYGNTKKAVLALFDSLKASGCKNVVVYDLARCDVFKALSDAFRFNKLVLATTTYNADIFPFMREFITHLTERNFSNRTVAFIENGSWAPTAAKNMKTLLDECEDLTFVESTVRILASLSEENYIQIENLVSELSK